MEQSNSCREVWLCGSFSGQGDSITGDKGWLHPILPCHIKGWLLQNGFLTVLSHKRAGSSGAATSAAHTCDTWLKGFIRKQPSWESPALTQATELPGQTLLQQTENRYTDSHTAKAVLSQARRLRTISLRDSNTKLTHLLQRQPRVPPSPASPPETKLQLPSLKSPSGACVKKLSVTLTASYQMPFLPTPSKRDHRIRATRKILEFLL